MCVRVEREAPLDLLAVAREHIGVALAELRAAGSSCHIHYVGAISELDASQADVDTARAHLLAAVSHARAYRQALG